MSYEDDDRKFGAETQGGEQDDEQLIDREGRPVTGIGRLDQVIGAKAADEFFRERDERVAYLARRALQRWSSGGRGYFVYRPKSMN